MKLEITGFTPIPDHLAAELKSFGAAAVYAAVWRMCQRYRGVCDASAKTIGETIYLGEKAVRNHLGRLVREGYLHVEETGAGKPNRYRLTDRVVFTSRLAIESSEPEPAPPPPPPPPTPEKNSGDPGKKFRGTPENNSGKETIEETLKKQQHAKPTPAKPDLERIVVVAKKFGVVINPRRPAAWVLADHITADYLRSWLPYHQKQTRPPGPGVYVDMWKAQQPAPAVGGGGGYRPPGLSDQTLAALRAQGGHYATI